MSICCAKFGGDAVYYETVGNVCGKPDGMTDDDFGWFVATTLTGAFLIQPLANAHNNEMASDHGYVRKFFTVALYAVGTILAGLVGGAIEAIIRLAIGIITSPLLLGVCAERDTCFNNMAMISGFALMSGEMGLRTMGYGFKGAYEMLFNQENLSQHVDPKNSLVFGCANCNWENN